MPVSHGSYLALEGHAWPGDAVPEPDASLLARAFKMSRCVHSLEHSSDNESGVRRQEFF